MKYYTNEEMIKIHNELLTTPIERREGVLVRYGVFKEEFPDIDFEDDVNKNSQQVNNDGADSDSPMGCCGIILWVIIFIFVIWFIGEVFS